LIIKVLIFGSGSIAQRHYSILKKIKKISEVKLYTKRKITTFSKIDKLNQIFKYNPNYFIIANKTSQHFETLKFIEENFEKKLILIEKPIFNFYKKININKNQVFVGYDLRFHPIILKIKKLISNKKINSVEIICNSYLPNWRKNIKYYNSYSSSKKFGGGVLLDLSHELDYTQYLFGNYNIISALNKKISNLKITSDDYLNLLLINKAKTYINISINYYSKINTRIININGDNISLKADLIKNTLEVFTNKYKLYKFKVDRDYTFKFQHKHILTNNKKYVASYLDGIKVLKNIDNIRKFK
tara:strand:- start:2022 stop:2924 length:903 start_codon:yes stop_codon:yes gene_type:complete